MAVRRHARPVAVQRCVRPAQGGDATAHHRGTVLRASRGRYHMLQLIGWVGIKPALLLFLSAFTDVRRCLSSRIRPSDFPEGAPLRFEGALCRFGFFAGEGASSNIVVLRRDIAQVIR